MIRHINLRYTILAFILTMLAIYTLTGWLVRYNFIHGLSPINTNLYKVLLLWGNGVGEKEQTHRFKIAAKRLNINLQVVSKFGNNFLEHYFINDPAELAARYFKPNIILTIERNIPALTTAPNYLVLDQGADAYYHNGHLGWEMHDRNIFKFAGILPTFPEISKLQEIYASARHKFSGFIWYPTIYKTAYTAKTPQKLFYPGGILRDITRSSRKYKTIFANLDKTGYLQVHGSSRIWAHTPKSRRAPIPFDGVSLLDAQNAAGISLVLHDGEHLYGNVPSSRIFEASAANTVIIADRHRFIMDNFGANVLYIDVENDADLVTAQIDQHMRWIKSHPKQALEMANMCHQIFLKKYNLEDQLQKLMALNAQGINNA